MDFASKPSPQKKEQSHASTNPLRRCAKIAVRPVIRRDSTIPSSSLVTCLYLDSFDHRPHLITTVNAGKYIYKYSYKFAFASSQPRVSLIFSWIALRYLNFPTLLRGHIKALFSFTRDFHNPRLVHPDSQYGFGMHGVRPVAGGARTAWISSRRGHKHVQDARPQVSYLKLPLPGMRRRIQAP